eukprot:g7000.t1
MPDEVFGAQLAAQGNAGAAGGAESAADQHPSGTVGQEGAQERPEEKVMEPAEAVVRENSSTMSVPVPPAGEAGSGSPVSPSAGTKFLRGSAFSVTGGNGGSAAQDSAADEAAATPPPGTRGNRPPEAALDAGAAPAAEEDRARAQESAPPAPGGSTADAPLERDGYKQVPTFGVEAEGERNDTDQNASRQGTEPQPAQQPGQPATTFAGNVDGVVDDKGKRTKGPAPTLPGPSSSEPPRAGREAVEGGGSAAPGAGAPAWMPVRGAGGVSMRAGGVRTGAADIGSRAATQGQVYEHQKQERDKRERALRNLEKKGPFVNRFDDRSAGLLADLVRTKNGLAAAVEEAVLQKQADFLDALSSVQKANFDFLQEMIQASVVTQKGNNPLGDYLDVLTEQADSSSAPVRGTPAAFKEMLLIYAMLRQWVVDTRMSGTTTGGAAEVEQEKEREAEMKELLNRAGLLADASAGGFAERAQVARAGVEVELLVVDFESHLNWAASLLVKTLARQQERSGQSTYTEEDVGKGKEEFFRIGAPQIVPRLTKEQALEIVEAERLKQKQQVQEQIDADRKLAAQLEDEEKKKRGGPAESVQPQAGVSPVAAGAIGAGGSWSGSGGSSSSDRDSRDPAPAPDDGKRKAATVLAPAVPLLQGVANAAESRGGQQQQERLRSPQRPPAANVVSSDNLRKARNPNLYVGRVERAETEGDKVQEVKELIKHILEAQRTLSTNREGPECFHRPLCEAASKNEAKLAQVLIDDLKIFDNIPGTVRNLVEWMIEVEVPHQGRGRPIEVPPGRAGSALRLQERKKYFGEEFAYRVLLFGCMQSRAKARDSTSEELLDRKSAMVEHFLASRAHLLANEYYDPEDITSTPAGTVEEHTATAADEHKVRKLVFKDEAGHPRARSGGWSQVAEAFELLSLWRNKEQSTFSESRGGQNEQEKDRDFARELYRDVNKRLEELSPGYLNDMRPMLAHEAVEQLHPDEKVGRLLAARMLDLDHFYRSLPKLRDRILGYEHEDEEIRLQGALVDTMVDLFGNALRDEPSPTTGGRSSGGAPKAWAAAASAAAG